MIRGPWISAHRFQYCSAYSGWEFHSSTYTLLGSNSITCGCKSRSKAMPHLHFRHDADLAQDSSTKERNPRSMGKRPARIPAYSTADTCILKLVISASDTSQMEFWRLGVGGGTWVSLRRHHGAAWYLEVFAGHSAFGSKHSQFIMCVTLPLTHLLARRLMKSVNR